MQNGTNTSLGPNMTSFSFNSRKFFFFFSRGGHFVCLPVPVCVCVWLADWLFLSLSLCLCLCMHWFSTTFIHLSPVISLCCLYQSFCCSVWTANAKKMHCCVSQVNKYQRSLGRTTCCSEKVLTTQTHSSNRKIHSFAQRNVALVRTGLHVVCDCIRLPSQEIMLTFLFHEFLTFVGFSL